MKRCPISLVFKEVQTKTKWDPISLHLKIMSIPKVGVTTFENNFVSPSKVEQVLIVWPS